MLIHAENDQPLKDWLGEIPSAPGGQVLSRYERLIGKLQNWRETIAIDQTDIQSAQWPLTQEPIFEGVYSIIKPVERSDEQNSTTLNQSDLFLKGHKDILVHFNRDRNSSLFNNQNNMEITEDNIRIYDGHWIKASQSLPVSLSFIPRHIKVIDPVDFFENYLIEARLNTESTYPLCVEEKRYLWPYKETILGYIIPQDIMNYTMASSQSNQIKINLKLPLENNWAVRGFQEYRDDHDVVRTETPRLAVWPDFVVHNPEKTEPEGIWGKYFYYKATVSDGEIDFRPFLPNGLIRSWKNRQWYMFKSPLLGFVGEVNNSHGLLLIKYQLTPPPTKLWKVAIDLGSTNTGVFSLGVEKDGVGWSADSNAKIQLLETTPVVKQITECEVGDITENFMGKFLTSRYGVFATKLIIPHPQDEDEDIPNDWLPREGFIFFPSVIDVSSLMNELKYGLKWNTNPNDYTLRTFLRCLLELTQAKALQEGARIVSVSYSYPSVFTRALITKHTNEWEGLVEYSSLTIEKKPLMEAEAVGRYLQHVENAPIATSVVALDIGGGTTDIALWTSNKLVCQESVKMAASVFGRYVHTETSGLKGWLTEILKSPPFNIKDFKLTQKKIAYAPLLFNALLEKLDPILEDTQSDPPKRLDNLIETISTNKKGQPLIAHIIFVFGALLYYVGLLARKLKMANSPKHYIYFCGRGGRFINWIPQSQDFVQDMFGSGLRGPQSGVPFNRPSTVIACSRMPKQEVGRGLLAESALEGIDRQQSSGGLAVLTPPTVTVGEEGFTGLKWDDNLNIDHLRNLKPPVPSYDLLVEIKNFIESFVQGPSTNAAAKLFGLELRPPPNFIDALEERLFGAAQGRIVYDLQHHPDEALLEPLFITEVKVLLETVASNTELFKGLTV